MTRYHVFRTEFHVRFGVASLGVRVVGASERVTGAERAASGLSALLEVILFQAGR